MSTVPSRFATVILSFAGLFGQRTAARVLLGLLVRAFVPRGPIVLGIDDTIERRRGARIAARGI